MNDCLWSWIFGECGEEHDKSECLSMNSEKGIELEKQYQKDVNEALTPVQDKWTKIRRNV